MRLVLLVGLLVAATGCGYQLRGTGASSELRLVGVPQYQSFGRTLRTELEAVGYDLVERADSVRTLQLYDVRFSRRGQSISERAQAQEFLIEASAELGVRDAEGSELLPRQTISATQEYFFFAERLASDEVLTSEQEAEEITRELEHELARRIIALLRGLPE